MAAILFYVFLASLLLQGIYFIFYFSRLLNYQDPTPKKQTKGVSVVIAAHNEKDNLIKLVPALLEQAYTNFEIILIDDRSTDGSKEYLQNSFGDQIKLISITQTPYGIHPKKHALTQGIHASEKEIILVTDADCLPKSRQWINCMVQDFDAGKELILGYSPYAQKPGLLNLMIRFETFYTAIQYFSFALSGSPYMGVGRNMAYKKEVFVQNKGFEGSQSITGGDDDLLVKEIARPSNTAIRISEESQMLSVPKLTYPAWFRQKKRHLSVGKYYKTGIKIRLGLLFLSQISFYTSIIYLFLSSELNYLIIIGFLLRTLVIMLIFTGICRNLREQFQWYIFPILDFLYVVNYISAGFAALISKKVKWI